MAAELLIKPYININGVDLSNRGREARFNRTRPPIDAAAFGDTSHVSLAGIEEWSLAVTFIQDYAAGTVHRTLDPLVGSTGFTIEFRKDNLPASPTNPKYTGTAILEGYDPANGSFGNLMTIPVTFRGAGDLTRAEA